MIKLHIQRMSAIITELLLLLLLVLTSGQVCSYAVGVRKCVRSSPVTLAFESVWWKVIRYPGTQDHCDIQVSTVYLPQVSLSTHLLNKLFVRMNSWVNCAPPVLTRDQTLASGFMVRRANHCTTEAHHFYNYYTYLI